MMRLGHAVLLLMLAPVPVSGAEAPSPPRRLALVVGSNRGAADRVPLRYAVADADRFADLVMQMGGVEEADRIVLRNPTRRGLVDAIGSTTIRAASAKAVSERVEVIVYFSGHADEQGLMLGREILPYRDLRGAIQGIGADVGITILDACASGAITRLKGGVPRPAFLSGIGSDIQGYAFLTSSSENEAAQESERLNGSFFTHALLTGLRGAADVSGDGKVTLGEAYQFAFSETLMQTTPTQAGAQHPAYDIQMAGTGDVVMTDVRENSASLILGPEYEGRFLMVSGRRHLVADLYKPSGRRIELGLEPGEYEIYLDEGGRLLKSTLALREGQRQDLVRDQLKQAKRIPTRLRGERTPDLGLPRFGIRYTARNTGGFWWGRESFASRLELVYRPTQRITIRPRFSPAWDSANVDYKVGANVDFHLRPEKSWRPYLSVGAEWQNRSLPEPVTIYDSSLGHVLATYDLGGWTDMGRDRTFFTAAIGLERRLSRHWSFVGELASTSPDREEVFGFNGLNWQSRSSGAHFELAVGLTFNFGGRGAPKPDSAKAP